MNAASPESSGDLVVVVLDVVVVVVLLVVVLLVVLELLDELLYELLLEADGEVLVTAGAVVVTTGVWASSAPVPLGRESR